MPDARPAVGRDHRRRRLARISVRLPRRAGAGIAAAVLVGTVAVSACSATAPSPPEPPVAAPPPAPPAACLLDLGGLATSTGVAWRPDQATASDTRCVYDPDAPAPSTGPASEDFLAVEIAPVTAADAAAELDTVGAVCADGSRAPIAAGRTGFVCRFRGGSVFGALVRTGQLVTVSTSAVPDGTTAARLVVALQQQLDALGR